MYLKASLLAAFAGLAIAQRPSDTSICDYYTGALLQDNTAANQATVLTLLVNTVVVGSYQKPDIKGVTFPNVDVAGILAPGMVNGEKVNLLPYFDGTLKSTNRGGSKGVSVNFLDGGGATPLKQNMPADDKSSNQYFLLTHLYEFFGALLGCSEMGMGAFPSYGGDTSMADVHKFMDLDEAQFTYFVEQVGLAAASFGVAKSDITTVANALNTTFGYRCSPPAEVIPGAGKEGQSICQASDCPMAMGGMCPPSGGMMPNATMTMKPSTPGSTSTSTTMPTAAAAGVQVSFGLMGLGLLGLFL